MPQNDQSLRLANSGEVRRPAVGAADETGRYMPPESVSTIQNSWVYGTPQSGCTHQAAARQAEAAAVSKSPETAAEENTSNAPAPIHGLNGSVQPGGISSAAAQSIRMQNPVNIAHTHMPANSDEAYQASLRSLLDRNIGYFVVATFQLGPQQSVTWQGILHTVGSDYIVLYQPDYERYISGDLYSLKFVQFHNVKGVPYCAASQSWQGQSSF